MFGKKINVTPCSVCIIPFDYSASFYFLTMQNTCTISFPANHASNGIYAVAISVEDYPKSTITIGSQVYTTSTRMSTVNLQVLKSITILLVSLLLSKEYAFMFMRYV